MLVNHSGDFLLNKQLILYPGKGCHSHSSCTQEFQKVARFCLSISKQAQKEKLWWNTGLW